MGNRPGYDWCGYLAGSGWQEDYRYYSFLVPHTNSSVNITLADGLDSNPTGKYCFAST